MATASLADIRDGTPVFIDANVFIYHFSGPTPLSPACSAFLTRVEEGRLRGVTSTLVLIEVLHRLMILEAIRAFQLSSRDTMRYLKEHPEQARTLGVHPAAPAKVRQMGVEVLTVEVEEIERSHEVKRRYEHEGRTYLGVLPLADLAFLERLHHILRGCVGRPVGEIGSLEVDV